jgi:hypothetical protein
MYHVCVTHMDDMQGWLDILSSSPASGITNRQLQFIFYPNCHSITSGASWQSLIKLITIDCRSIGVDVIYLNTLAKSEIPFANELRAKGVTGHMHYLQPFGI